MDTQKQQIVDNLKQANNILVTVSNNPSVDQLAACIGLTLALNKMKKHATAVFSGVIPPIIEFLQPEKTLEKTTDSLRDFIIAIDKAKADKLRYKVEDKFVKIFITPYRTSINEKDLQFSEGDFNVDVVLALGVHKQSDLDQAITAHGRILHDATIISVNTQPNNELGSINLVEQQASSLSEMAVELLDLLDKSMINDQVATTLLTGIVAETDRFRNAKTTPATMSVSAELLTAGANQQLVASKLEAAPPTPKPQSSPVSTPQPVPAEPKSEDGTLEIHHDDGEAKPSEPVDAEKPDESKAPQIHIDEDGHVHDVDEMKPTVEDVLAMAPPAPQFSAPPLAPTQLQPLTPPQLPPLSPPPTAMAPPAPAPTPGFGSAPPLAPPSPSPLNPFAPQANPPLASLGLPPFPPTQGSFGQAPPAPQFSAPPLAPTQLQPLTPPQLPPLSPPPTAMAPPAPAPTLQPPPQPPAGAPEIIQPDPNAVLQAQTQQEEPALPPPSTMPTIRTEGPHLMMQPPTFGNELAPAGNMVQGEEEDIPSGSALSLPQVEKPGLLLNREPLQPQSSIPSPTPQTSVPPASPSLPPPPKAPSPATPAPSGSSTEPPLIAEESISSLERDVSSPHLDYIESPVPALPGSPSKTDDGSMASAAVVQPTAAEAEAAGQASDVADARSAINAAFGDALEPVEALNAQPLGGPLHDEGAPAPPAGFSSDPNNSGTPPPPPVPPPLIPSAPA